MAISTSPSSVARIFAVEPLRWLLSAADEPGRPRCSSSSGLERRVDHPAGELGDQTAAVMAGAEAREGLVERFVGQQLRQALSRLRLELGRRGPLLVPHHLGRGSFRRRPSIPLRLSGFAGSDGPPCWSPRPHAEDRTDPRWKRRRTNASDLTNPRPRSPPMLGLQTCAMPRWPAATAKPQPCQTRWLLLRHR